MSSKRSAFVLIAFASIGAFALPRIALSDTSSAAPAAPAAAALSLSAALETRVIEGVLSNDEVDVIALPAGFTKENAVLVAATVTDAMPNNMCKTGHCAYRNNLLANNPITTYNFEGYGDGYGVRLAYVSTENDEVIIHHKELVMVPLGRSGSTKETRPVYQGQPYKLVLLKVSR